MPSRRKRNRKPAANSNDELSKAGNGICDSFQLGGTYASNATRDRSQWESARTSFYSETINCLPPSDAMFTCCGLLMMTE